MSRVPYESKCVTCGHKRWDHFGDGGYGSSCSLLECSCEQFTLTPIEKKETPEEHNKRLLEAILYAAYKFDDKPHHLFSSIRKAAEGHEHQAEIERLMDLCYENIHGWTRGKK